MNWFNMIKGLSGQEYERYLPTAFDSSLTLLEKVNKVIETLNQIVEGVNTVADYVDGHVDTQNEKITQLRDDFEILKDWIENEGLQERTVWVLNEWFDSGRLAQIINNDVFDMKVDTATFEQFVVSTNQELTETKQDFTTQFNQLGINVKDFGAKGDGITDDTLAIQSAIDYASENTLKKVIFPFGQYVVSHIDFLTKKYSGIMLSGIDALLIQKPDTQPRNDLADGLLFFDSLSNLVDDNFTPKNAISDITIENLHFYADIERIGFNELIHHISAHGVDNFKVNNCRFYGFLGDAIAINSGFEFSPFTAFAYNSNVTIRDCFFDGINKNNRQAISIYHCDSFVIDNNIIKNTTRPDMPGGIDIEPAHETTLARTGVVTNNKLDNIGGNIGAIAILIKNKDTIQTNFTIANNTITNVSKCGISVTSGDMGEGSKNSMTAVSIYDNYLKDCKETIRVHWVNGVHIYDNYFENVDSPLDSHFFKADNITIEKNIFKNILSERAVTVNACSNVVIRNNAFYNPVHLALDIFGWDFILEDNRFLTTTDATGKIPFATNEQVFINSDFVIKRNKADNGYININTLTHAYFLLPMGAPTYFSLPNKFPMGTTQFEVTTSDHPIPTYDGRRTGNIITIRNTLSHIGVLQIYVSVDRRDSIYFRRALTDSTWTEWLVFNSSYAGATEGRPPASQLLPGTQYFDLDLQKPVYSNGTFWVDGSGEAT